MSIQIINNKIHLQEGYISLHDLSLWFGLSKNCLSKTTKKAKEKKLAILEAYADYHIQNNKIYIDLVKEPIYSKAKKTIAKEFDKEWGNINEFTKKERIDTCARVGAAIYNNNKEVSAQIAKNTSIVYTKIIKQEQYGKTYNSTKGTKGKSKYVYLNAEGTDYLTNEQMKIVQACADEAFNSNTIIMNIMEDYDNNEITAKERNEALQEVLNPDNLSKKYLYYKELLKEKLGFVPIKKTKLVKK